MKRIACIVALSVILINTHAQKENSFRVIAFFTAKNDPAQLIRKTGIGIIINSSAPGTIRVIHGDQPQLFCM